MNQIIKEAIIECDFDGVSGHRMNLIERWQKCAERQGVPDDKIEKVLKMARAVEGYDNFVKVLLAHCSNKPFAIADNELND